MGLTQRAALPTRRPTVTVETDWEGHPITVTVGFYPAGHPRAGAPGEVFADTLRGGQMAHTVADACVLVSLALQHGIAPADLAKSLGRVPGWVLGAQVLAPASPVGAVVQAVVEVAA